MINNSSLIPIQVTTPHSICCFYFDWIIPPPGRNEPIWIAPFVQSRDPPCPLLALPPGLYRIPFRIYGAGGLCLLLLASCPGWPRPDPRRWMVLSHFRRSSGHRPGSLRRQDLVGKSPSHSHALMGLVCLSGDRSVSPDGLGGTGRRYRIWFIVLSPSSRTGRELTGDVGALRPSRAHSEAWRSPHNRFATAGPRRRFPTR
jgi:hypothetical protein